MIATKRVEGFKQFYMYLALWSSIVSAVGDCPRQSAKGHIKDKEVEKDDWLEDFFCISMQKRIGSYWNFLTKDNYLHWASKSKFKESFPQNKDQIGLHYWR